MIELLRECSFCPEHGIIVTAMKVWPFIAATAAYYVAQFKGGR